MSRYRHHAMLIVLACSTLSACGGMTYESCVDQYAKHGATDRLVGFAMGQCRTATNPERSSAERKEALCIVRQVPDMKTEAAVVIARQSCK